MQMPNEEVVAFIKKDGVAKMLARANEFSELIIILKRLIAKQLVNKNAVIYYTDKYTSANIGYSGVLFFT